MKRIGFIVLASAVVVLAAFYVRRTGHPPAGQPPLVQINDASLSALRSEFNHTSDKLRVILLLSPT
jgi:hypothetical protein